MAICETTAAQPSQNKTLAVVIALKRQNDLRVQEHRIDCRGWAYLQSNTTVHEVTELLVHNAALRSREVIPSIVL